ncbi:oligopeptide ABC transporter substrate-binding protein [Vaginisenegalia massiliensis]|uniref:oligopeptide ABC transporter substrate-binding protein n=1 Tax=Vaginisenegalia massiliensis TaxID=2058294 RepID=UPI000F52976D|nr:oligopeptide ABC transporter substrate-binding protein [Vaginisenegalia massiliensis]
MSKLLIKRASLLAATLTLGSATVGSLAPVYAAAPKFNTEVKNEGTAIKGGVLKYALVGDPFEGVMSPMLSDSKPDADIEAFFNPSLYGYDENFVIDDSGFAKVEFNKDEKTATIKIPENTKWDDGQPLTIDDVIFPYYVVGSKDYTGVRYDERFENIEGMTEYHKGEAKEISGLERVDDYTLKVHYKNFNNSMMQAGGGVSEYVAPKHILEKEDIAKLEDSPYVRKNPVGFGPFKVKSVVPGESVELVANEYYYKGKPKLDGVVIDVVSPTSAVAEMKAGKYDIAKLPTDEYETFKDAKNFTNLGQVSNAYTYIGFKMGKWDAKKGENVMDPKKVTANKALRQAMAYAIDNNAVGEKFYNGLRISANSPIVPVYKDYYNKDAKAYKYDPEKAKQVLAKAGFKDKDGDGFVEDPKGKAFKLKFASMSGGETAEPLAQYYLEAWKQVGINVELVDGRLMEMNAFYERVEKDDPNVDVFQAAWSTGGDPDPAGLYSRIAQFNYSRFSSKENDQLLADIASDKSFDPAYKKEAFFKWQDYFQEELPIIPTLFRYEVTAVNKRVSNYNIKFGSETDWETVELLADKPAAE